MVTLQDGFSRQPFRDVHFAVRYLYRELSGIAYVEMKKGVLTFQYFRVWLFGQGKRNSLTSIVYFFVLVPVLHEINVHLSLRTVVLPKGKTTFEK